MENNQFLVTKLDISKSAHIVGDDMNLKFQEILRFMEITATPIDLLGPPGCGKTHLGTALAIEWARRHGTQAYTSIHDGDTTKSSAIAGFRLIDGSSVVVSGSLTTAMEDNSCIYVDEFTHARESVQGSYNTASDRNHQTTAGNKTFRGGPNFRLIIGHNTVNYSGNIPLMPSFASRLACFNFDYPSAKTEAQIALDIANSELALHRPDNPVTKVPNSVACYLTSVMRNFREKAPTLGLSARNVATAILLLEVCDLDLSKTIDPHFNPEPVKQKVAEYVLLSNRALTSSDLRSKPVINTMTFFSQVGVEKARQCMLQSFMFYPDVKGGTVRSDKSLKEQFHKEAI